MRRFWVLFLLFLLLFFPLSAQEDPAADETGPEAESFPVALFLEAAGCSPAQRWEPDWPMELPPDAFTVAGGGWISVAVILEEKSFCLRRSPEGLTLEFPFLFRGEMAQAVLSYTGQEGGDEQVLSSAHIGSPSGFDGTADKAALVKLEILEYSDDYPSLLRVFEDSVYSFVLLRRGAGFISESWFDAEGVFLGAYEYNLTKVFSDREKSVPRERIASYAAVPDGEEVFRDFDSRFRMTSSGGGRGEFSAVYFMDNLPRYWDRKPREEESEEDGITDGAEKGGRYSLQWDEAGFLTRLSSAASDSDSGFLDCRYDYTLDSRGNWIERRETRMIRRFGYIVPEPGPVIRRTFEYGETPPVSGAAAVLEPELIGE